MKANNITGKPGRPHPGGSDDLAKAKLRKENLLCDRYQRENDEAAGKLINAEDESRRDVQKILYVRDRLRGLGAILSPQMEGMNGPKRQVLIDSAVDAILLEFSK